jgi:hypothetical protein
VEELRLKEEAEKEASRIAIEEKLKAEAKAEKLRLKEEEEAE